MRDRIVGSRVDVVTTMGELIRTGYPVDGVRISFDGDRGEAWDADFALSDPSTVPTTPMDILDGRSGCCLRVWWRELTDAGWQETPVGTFVVEDPKIRDTGTLSIQVPGLDPLAVARRGGYGPTVVRVGGKTVSDALATLFAVVAPGFKTSIEPCSTILPTAYDLWDRDPATDWTEIAAVGGMVVRTDPLGVITVARPTESDTVVADWQEGPDCPVEELAVEIRTSSIPRRVVVVSTAPDVSPPVVGTWDNPDADQQMITTETRIQSSTVTTKSAAEALAKLTGMRWARPVQTVTVRVPQRGGLRYRDLVNLARIRVGVAGSFRVAGWDLTLRGPADNPEPMTVRMMPRQFQ